ncbi:MAG TPA: sulfatase-like hydrolase/transferase [Mycobacteriales bacterium]|nr:sulfatase-like hydrolase/transferase [Mycobacteriales bacterium]
MSSVPPNILLILADDMGYGDLSAVNDDRSSTPRLDALLAESVGLTQQYSGSPVCAPARAALLTGRYPHRTGAIDTFELLGSDRLGLSEITLADRLNGAGYATGLVGKWHLGAFDQAFHPNSRGFDEFVGFRGGWQDYYDWTIERNGTRSTGDGRYLTDVFTDEAVSFIRRHRSEPFFLHVAYNAPHFPLQAPEEEIAPFAATGRYTRGVSTLYGMIHRMDTGIGLILDELKAQGLADNTIVIFASDNGPSFSGRGEESTERFNCGLRGEKTLVFEGGIRVPAMIRWPAGLNPGRIDEPIHFIDWVPTLLSTAGQPVQGGPALDGHDLLDVLRGNSRPSPVEYYWQWNRYDPVIGCNIAARHGDWKLVRPPIAEAMRIRPEDGESDRDLKYHPERYDRARPELIPHDRPVPAPESPLLFDLRHDLLEENDLSGRHEEHVRALLTAAEKWFADVNTS